MDEVNADDDSHCLFLPYWLHLIPEEIQSLFVDRSEFSAHNKCVVVQDAITEQRNILKSGMVGPIYCSLLLQTVRSHTPYMKLLEKLKYLNEEG